MPQLKKANEISTELAMRMEIFDKDLKQIQDALDIIRKTKIANSVDVWDDLQSAHLSHLAQMTQQFAVVKQTANMILISKVRLRRDFHNLEQNERFYSLSAECIVQTSIQD